MPYVSIFQVNFQVLTYYGAFLKFVLSFVSNVELPFPYYVVIGTGYRPAKAGQDCQQHKHVRSRRHLVRECALFIHAHVYIILRFQPQQMTFECSSSSNFSMLGYCILKHPSKCAPAEIQIQNSVGISTTNYCRCMLQIRKTLAICNRPLLQHQNWQMLKRIVIYLCIYCHHEN